MVIDINECDLGTYNCSENSNCTNTAGSYVCTCKDGFSGSEDSCSGSFYYFYFFSVFLKNDNN